MINEQKVKEDVHGLIALNQGIAQAELFNLLNLYDKVEVLQALLELRIENKIHYVFQHNVMFWHDNDYPL